MPQAFSRLKDILVAEEFLKHPDINVRLATISCISEIMLITAPDQPYEDDQMKDVLQLIVSSFVALHDKFNCLYDKIISILKTMAKVQSCLVMLDLECDDLILEMFQHFYNSARHGLPNDVLSWIETIMTLVINESEVISPNLLFVILDFVRVKNKQGLGFTYKLGKKVIRACADMLKPFMSLAVKSRRISLDAYGKIVSNLCPNEAVNSSEVSTAITVEDFDMAKDEAELTEVLKRVEEIPKIVHKFVALGPETQTVRIKTEILEVGEYAKEFELLNFPKAPECTKINFEPDWICMGFPLTTTSKKAYEDTMNLGIIFEDHTVRKANDELYCYLVYWNGHADSSCIVLEEFQLYLICWKGRPPDESSWLPDVRYLTPGIT